MNIPGLITAFRASGAFVTRRLVVHGASEGLATQAVDGSALLIGVTTDVRASEGDHMDVIRSGLALVVYGADVVAGDPLTADATGAAIPAEAGNFFIGYAEVPGSAEEIGSVWIAPGQLPAAAGG